MRALISVSDKTGCVKFAENLVSLGYEIISTGGTYQVITQAGIKATKVEDITKHTECFDGRVKTLHPSIHGGILYRRDDKTHIKQAKELNISAIHLVCVNLYPFEQTTKTTDNFDTIIENIDIGGPAMIRSSAKNYQDVLIVTDTDDYDKTIRYIKNNDNDIEYRQELMTKAFEHTAAYDAYIANYMNQKYHDNLGQKQFIVGKKVFDTRYGENPHQRGALYEFENYYTDNFCIKKGEPSFNNINDINSAVKIATAFGDANAVCIVKHGNPCGFAIKDSLLTSYIQALKCDPISAFGGVVAVNGVVDETMAKKMSEVFLEVIFAGDFTKEAIKVFESKKKLKLFSQNSDKLIKSNDTYDFKHINGGFVYQEADTISKFEVQNSIAKSKNTASEQQFNDMNIAYVLAALTKSNCITYVKNQTLIAIGMGMTSRIDAAKAAVSKAISQDIDMVGCVMASEAFVPFRDTIDEAHKVGVSCIIQPGGSIRDTEVIEACGEYNIIMYFSGFRHFLH